MNRLTMRDEKGAAYLAKVKSNEQVIEGTKNTLECVYESLQKLAEYEDLELTPEQLREVDKLYTEKCEEVAELTKRLTKYEELEKSGLLMRLPCKVGDTVYLTTISKYMIIEGYSLQKNSDLNRLYFHCRCAEHDKSKRKGERVINVCKDCVFGDKCFRGFYVNYFGSTVFHSKEEAEQALKERGRDV